MLADEVGLGKTIEASVILKYLKDKNKKLKSLIIVPDSLIYQWKTELEYKFWLDVSIERINQNSDIAHVAESKSPKRRDGYYPQKLISSKHVDL